MLLCLFLTLGNVHASSILEEAAEPNHYMALKRLVDRSGLQWPFIKIDMEQKGLETSDYQVDLAYIAFVYGDILPSLASNKAIERLLKADLSIYKESIEIAMQAPVDIQLTQSYLLHIFTEWQALLDGA